MELSTAMEGLLVQKELLPQEFFWEGIIMNANSKVAKNLPIFSGDFDFY